MLTTVLPLQFSSSSPLANAKSVDASSKIELTFDMDLVSSTVNNTNIIVRGQQNGSIDGSWRVEGAVATFEPTQDFEAGEVIHVEIKSTLKSTENAQAIPKNFSFTANASNNETLGQN